MKLKLTRRRFLQVLGGAAAGVAIGGPLYAFRFEPYWVATERISLTYNPENNPPSGLKIVHLSDLHYSKIVPADYLEKWFQETNQLQPDLILLTGDYITQTKNNSKWVQPLGKILASLQARLGVFASLGNHDGGEWAGEPTTAVREALQKAGIRVLINESVKLSYKNQSVTIVGLGDLWAGDFDTIKAFETVEPNEFTIALSHNPDTLKYLEKSTANLVLCGHTHGGQVCIPFIGPPILPVDDKRFSAGLYKVGGFYAYVNRGLGMLRKVRFNCRPEITWIDIV